MPDLRPEAILASPEKKELNDAIAEAKRFAEAKFYDCQDPETLYHFEVEDAIERYLDDAWEPGKTKSMRQLIADLCPITVKAYNPMKISNRWPESMAERFLEDMEENLGEEYGNPDGDTEFWSEHQRTEIQKELEAVLAKAAAGAEVWACEDVAKREYSEEEVLEIMDGHQLDCMNVEDHEWEERPDGLFKCKYCSFLKSRGDLMFYEALTKKESSDG